MSNPHADKTQSSAPADWNSPKPDTLTKPTWWPAALAFGITLTAWGLIASPVILAMGLVVVIASLARWIGDICRERKER